MAFGLQLRALGVVDSSFLDERPRLSATLRWVFGAGRELPCEFERARSGASIPRKCWFWWKLIMFHKTVGAARGEYRVSAARPREH